MEKRNGVWTSQTREDDARDIASLARRIAESTDDPQVKEWAEKIRRLARDLEDS
ncbi:hypothetical protein [Demequina sp. NBRC 110053]|uniref:hypothetical protein n=1 Tax=Demequina sp. NBRC 110053 TaxID=1570342 RepID=UPI0013565E4A|nr:hypothetical protein [Demequina sp. NBRC 110053]